MRRLYSDVQGKPFSLLAEVYDAIMSDVEYDAWTDFILDLALEAGTEVGRVLDLGCGTGNSSEPFVDDAGSSVTGVDLSAEMLAVARHKLPTATFVEGDFTTFELGQTFDLVVSVFDSLNNLLDPDDFRRTAERARYHLNPGGVFIFDVNTTVGLRNLWEDDRAEGWVDDVYYLWEHSFDEAHKARAGGRVLRKGRAKLYRGASRAPLRPGGGKGAAARRRFYERANPDLPARTPRRRADGAYLGRRSTLERCG